MSRPTSPTHSHDGDGASTSSTLSVSKRPIECPYCKEELQFRSIMKHIIYRHEKEFCNSSSVKWFEEAEKGEPLCVWWERTNDFDECEVEKFWCCLSSGTPFRSEDRARLYFRKADKKTIQEHNKLVTKFKKIFLKLKEKTKKDRRESPLAKRVEANDPVLARGIWNGILMFRKIAEWGLAKTARMRFTENTPVYILTGMTYKLGSQEHSAQFKEVPFSYFLENRYNPLMEKIKTLQEQKCLNVPILLELWNNLKTLWHIELAESIADSSLNRIGVLQSEFPEFKWGEDYRASILLQDNVAF